MSSSASLTASTLALQLPNIAIGLLVVLFLFISVVMVLIVLIQRPQGGGLSGAFGSSAEGAGQTAFGAKTGDVLTTATIVVFLVFLSMAVVLNYVVKPGNQAAQTPVVSSPDPAAPVPVDAAGTVPVQVNQSGTATPTQTGVGTEAPAPIRLETPEGAPIKIEPVSPEELEYLRRGLVPPKPGEEPKPMQAPKQEGEAPAGETPSGTPTTPPADPPATPPANPQ